MSKKLVIATQDARLSFFLSKEVIFHKTKLNMEMHVVRRGALCLYMVQMLKWDNWLRTRQPKSFAMFVDDLPFEDFFFNPLLCFNSHLFCWIRFPSISLVQKLTKVSKRYSNCRLICTIDLIGFVCFYKCKLQGMFCNIYRRIERIHRSFFFFLLLLDLTSTIFLKPEDWNVK